MISLFILISTTLYVVMGLLTVMLKYGAVNKFCINITEKYPNLIKPEDRINFEVLGWTPDKVIAIVFLIVMFLFWPEYIWSGPEYWATFIRDKL